MLHVVCQSQSKIATINHNDILKIESPYALMWGPFRCRAQLGAIGQIGLKLALYLNDTKC